MLLSTKPEGLLGLSEGENAPDHTRSYTGSQRFPRGEIRQFREESRRAPPGGENAPVHKRSGIGIRLRPEANMCNFIQGATSGNCVFVFGGGQYPETCPRRGPGPARAEDAPVHTGSCIRVFRRGRKRPQRSPISEETSLPGRTPPRGICFYPRVFRLASREKAWFRPKLSMQHVRIFEILCVVLYTNKHTHKRNLFDRPTWLSSCLLIGSGVQDCSPEYGLLLATPRDTHCPPCHIIAYHLCRDMYCSREAPHRSRQGLYVGSRQLDQAMNSAPWGLADWGTGGSACDPAGFEQTQPVG